MHVNIRDSGAAGWNAYTRFRDGQLPGVLAKILNRSRIYIPKQFYPIPIAATAAENSDCQARRLLIGGHDGAAIFRMRESPGGHTREGEGPGLDLTLVW